MIAPNFEEDAMDRPADGPEADRQGADGGIAARKRPDPQGRVVTCSHYIFSVRRERNAVDVLPMAIENTGGPAVQRPDADAAIP